MLDQENQEAHKIFIDREYSWLKFNGRVLEEALDPANPLLERIKFLSIVANNLDEFFEVRVSALLQKVEAGISLDGIAGLDSSAKLSTVLKLCQQTVKQQIRIWNEDLIPKLKENGVMVKSISDLSKEEERFLHQHFKKKIYHLLTPIKVDPAHPFPWVINKALCLLVLLKGDGKQDGWGVITIPRSLPRLLSLPSKEKNFTFIFIQDVIQHYIHELFKGYEIKGCAPFRVTRNSNLYLEEEEAGSLIDAVEAVVHSRRKGDVVRLEIDKSAPKRIVDALIKTFDIDSHVVFRVEGPITLNSLTHFHSMIPLSHLKYAPFHPSHLAHFLDYEDLFQEIRHRDVLLHHPFDSYDPVVRFIQSAAEDPKVQMIKQTLYRTNEESPIMYALLEAAEQGKEVIAVVELKARFDEKSNISWARQLEEKGVTVVFGLVGLKTHCKLSLVIRKEGSGFIQYAHIGTGNYNPETARRYTDLSLLTSDLEITEGVSEIFNFLTAQSRNPDFKRLQVGPVNFLSETLRLIHREKKNALAGKPSGIMAKMNALFDKEVIQALYQASQAGVKVRLIVRGICALRPGVKGLSENIQVKSIVGRFLEHSRLYHFENEGNPEIFISSGDWMQRNLRERVEASIPIKDINFKRHLEEILTLYWADNAKARIMRADGTYYRIAIQSKDPFIHAQDWFSRRAENPEVTLPPIPKTNAFRPQSGTL